MTYIRAIKNMYRSQNEGKKVGGDSEHLPLEIGLHLGSILSLFLFSLIMDVL